MSYDLSPELTAKLEALVAAQRAPFKASTKTRVMELRRRVNVLRQYGSDDLARDWKSFYLTAHDLKGTGGSFGFPLITGIGERLCRLIQSVPSPTHEDLARAETMLEDILSILSADLTADGGERGSALAVAYRFDPSTGMELAA